MREGAGESKYKVVFGGGYMRRTKKYKTNKGEEEGGNKYTKVIFLSLWTCGHCGERGERVREG